MSKSPPLSRLGRARRAVRHRGVDWLSRTLDYSWVQYILFLAFVMSTVAIITAGFQLTQPALTKEDVGKISRRDIKANRAFSYAVLDESATQLAQDQQAARVPPVYEWREDIQQSKRDAISAAFSSSRRAMAERIRTDKGIQATLSPENQALLKELPNDQLVGLLDQDTALVLGRELRQEHFTPLIGEALSDEAFEFIARRGFSARLEMTLLTLVDRVMERLVMDHTRHISDDPKRGIYLRRLNGQTLLIEYHLTDLDDRIVAPESLLETIRRLGRNQLNDYNVRADQLQVINIVAQFAEPNTRYNDTMTQQKRAEARESVPEVVRTQTYQKGQIIVDKGQRITGTHVALYQTMEASNTYVERAQILTGLVILSLLFIIVLTLFGRHNLEGFDLRRKDVGFLATVLLLFLLIARLGKALSLAFSEQVPIEVMQLSIPLAAGAMIVRVILRTQVAVVFAVVFSLLVGLIMDQLLLFTAFTLIGSIVGIGFVKQIKRRLSIMFAGLVVGGVNAILVGSMYLVGAQFGVDALSAMVAGVLSGAFCGLLVLALLPLFEAGFRYTTDIKLLELSSMDHPLLRELILSAPGSYHHSMMVGSLTEAAAEAIGCNALLARVGAYYHDIGKAKNPGYFAENQKAGVNPHDKLKPNMSALIIKAHVKDGIEMARSHGLPEEIVNFIEQHHGQSLIAYFYHKAKKMEDPDIPEVDEKDYRYPGPKPQTRETAICLLADGVEAASRAMPSPTPARLKGLVQNMINKAFTDGQLDDCDLTLKDLNVIAQAFMRILTGIYHHRPEYPEQKKAKAEKVQEVKKQEGGRANQKKRVIPRTDGASVRIEAVTPHPKEEQDQDESGDHDAGLGEQSSDAQDDPKGDEPKSRESLPRLGSP